MTPVFRFAPSPNGELHLGHAYSALMNQDMARKAGGRMLLRIEDIDPQRCRPEFESQIYDDLEWLGLDWEKPVRRQSDHIADYRAALEQLAERKLVYPSFLSRASVKARVAEAEAAGRIWPRDPDGTPLYPTEERKLDHTLAQARIATGERHLWRLDMDKACALVHSEIRWTETGSGRAETIIADPQVWGDVVLWRWDAPSSYHLSVVVDDALQGVSHVVRGLDLYQATPVHRLLQVLLDLPEPIYHHHRLVLDEDGHKLSKSIGSTGLHSLRQAGFSPSDIRRRIGLTTG
ncbi:MAG: glutamyl-Q tRNA(Asp) synthetase [Pseudomonadota bacterium]|jgi:glutamyl-Q tRNA(Asp) synthetase